MERTKVLKGRERMNSFINFISQQKNGVDNKKYRRSLEDVFSSKNRMEQYLKVGGVTFIDDSKSHTTNALWYSLECLVTQVVLIVESIDDECLSELDDLLSLKVKAIVCLGECEDGVKDKGVYVVDSMEEAVQKAYELSTDGDAVLFSPLCKINTSRESSSFRRAVRKL